MKYTIYVYDKYVSKLQYPVNIKESNPKLAKIIISQLGGPDGELGASMRYLNQRYAAPYAQVKGLLTDIGTEELAHMEIISAILFQLTRNLTPEEIKASGFDAYFVDHTTGIYPASASGVPFTAAYFQSKGDPITDLVEDMAADGAALLGRPFKKLQEQLSILFEITSCRFGGRLFHIWTISTIYMEIKKEIFRVL